MTFIFLFIQVYKNIYLISELTTPRSRNPERKFRSRTSVSRNTVTTSTTPETLEENDKKLFSSSPQPYYDDSSLFAKTRDDRKIGGSAEDLANTAVVAIHTLATAPPSNYEFSKNTNALQTFKIIQTNHITFSTISKIFICSFLFNTFPPNRPLMVG